VVDPTALYLDEPTSGLSSSDSMLIMKAMWSLSCLQCTIVAIIHSPPVMVWKMFTDVLLLARGGHVAFFGPVNSVMRYWNHIGFNIGEVLPPPVFRYR
jgi:ABC-type multidrug transport system ATPase subunit